MKNLLIILLLVNLSIYAQQDAQYTNYMYNTININPAYAGSRGVAGIFGLYRAQWVGLDGAPVTSSISFNSPIVNSNLGVGFSVENDRLGASNKTAVSADVSYTIRTSFDYKLSFGLKGTANLLNVDYSKLNKYDMNDPKFQNSINSEFSPNIGAGLYFYSDKLYLGLSVPNFLETSYYDDNAVATSLDIMHFYLIGGYIFYLSPMVQFKPAFMCKTVMGSPLQLDLSANFKFYDKFTIGAAWRWDAAASFIAGFQVNQGLHIGYGYDLETTQLANYNSGSHEIFLRFELFKKHDRVVSPRFF